LAPLGGMFLSIQSGRNCLPEPLYYIILLQSWAEERTGAFCHVISSFISSNYVAVHTALERIFLVLQFKWAHMFISLGMMWVAHGEANQI